MKYIFWGEKGFQISFEAAICRQKNVYLWKFTHYKPMPFTKQYSMINVIIK